MVISQPLAAVSYDLSFKIWHNKSSDFSHFPLELFRNTLTSRFFLSLFVLCGFFSSKICYSEEEMFNIFRNISDFWDVAKTFSCISVGSLPPASLEVLRN